jgi:hypothetical protein
MSYFSKRQRSRKLPKALEATPQAGEFEDRFQGGGGQHRPTTRPASARGKDLDRRHMILTEVHSALCINQVYRVCHCAFELPALYTSGFGLSGIPCVFCQTLD